MLRMAAAIWLLISFYVFVPVIVAEEKLSFRCTFGLGTQAEWHNGEFKVEETSSEIIAVHIDSIDLVPGTARVIGNSGSSDVQALHGDSGITLIEGAETGNFMFITIFGHQPNGQIPAVMSRHMDFGAPFPSQLYGNCIPW